MRVRLLAAAVLAVVLVPQPSAAAGVTVRVEHLMYLPGTVSVALGEKVTWAFPEISRHTTTSDQGFWDSGPRSSGASYARVFTSAGSFPYHCTFHPSMHGVVRVPVTVTAPSEAKRVLRWSTAGARAGTTFDVQVKRGSGPWRSFRTDTTKPRAALRPGRSGTYKVRARTTRRGVDSGWSKPVRVTVA